MYPRKIISNFIGIEKSKKLVKIWLKINNYIQGREYKVDYSSLDYENKGKLKKAKEMSKSFSDLDYKDVYSKQEVKYWEHIPEWISTDSGKNNVMNVLDIGCHFGTLAYFSKLVYNCNVYVLDVQDYCKIPQINFQQMNIEFDDLPSSFPKKYDRIIFTEVLEHLHHHPNPTLKKINKWLKKDGIFFLSTPMAEDWGKLNTYNNFKDIPYPSKKEEKFIDKHIYHYNENELLEVLELANFEVLEIKYSEGYIGRRHFNIKATK